MKRRRHAPEQIIRNLRPADRLLAEAYPDPGVSPCAGGCGWFAGTAGGTRPTSSRS